MLPRLIFPTATATHKANKTTHITSRPRGVRGPACTLASLVVVVVAAITPVRGGIMDFSPPGIIQYGTCAQPKSHETFHFSKFSGMWYQIEMVPNSYMEAKKCITLDFRWNGEEYNVTTNGLNEYDERVQQDATIKRVEAEDAQGMQPYLQIWAPGVPPVPYHVIKTDYENFACVYSCYELFSLMFEAFSVLTRDLNLNNISIAKCHQAFASLNLNLSVLEPVEMGGNCLDRHEGSGEAPMYPDEEVDKEEEEEALVLLTGREPTQDDDEIAQDSLVYWQSGRAGEKTMMEEETENLEETQGGAGRGETSSSNSRHRTLVVAMIGSNEGPESTRPPGSLGRGSHRGLGRKWGEGGSEYRKGGLRVKEEEEEGQHNALQDSQDSLEDFNDLFLDFQEQESSRGRGEANPIGMDEKDKQTLTTTPKQDSPSHGRRDNYADLSGASAPGPPLLVLCGLLSAVLWRFSPV